MVSKVENRYYLRVIITILNLEITYREDVEQFFKFYETSFFYFLDRSLIFREKTTEVKIFSFGYK